MITAKVAGSPGRRSGSACRPGVPATGTRVAHRSQPLAAAASNFSASLRWKLGRTRYPMWAPTRVIPVLNGSSSIPSKISLPV